jgi:glycosyltransferase involved in cell wall biosynthesis
MMRIEDIAKIRAPIVWNCQDMWPFTGGCHFSGDCKAYVDSCGNCPMIQGSDIRDLSARTISRKFRAYSKIESMTVVGVSKWIAGCARESSLFTNRQIKNIPNGVDVELFKPIDKRIAKDIFGIPRDKKVILFGAMNPTGDSRKGGKELFDAINLLDLDSVIFVIAGSSRPEKMEFFKHPVYFISPLRDEVSLPMMYNVADVMVVPSLEENLSNSIIESLSCGVPVVSFDIGGNSDIVDHKKNGYLARERSSADLSEGISWILKHQRYEELAKLAREKVLEKFDIKIVAKKYMRLYDDVLKDQK